MHLHNLCANDDVLVTESDLGVQGSELWMHQLRLHIDLASTTFKKKLN